MKLMFSILVAICIASPAFAAPECTYRQAKLSPDMLQAQSLLKQDNPFAILFLLRSVTKKEPTNALAWRWLAETEEKVGDNAAALDAANKVVDLNPCDYGAREERAFAEKKLGLLRKAYDDFTAVIDYDPKNAFAHEMRGDMLLDAAEVMAALADFDAALASGPPNVDLLLNRGGVLQELGRFKQAIAAYDMALRIEPGNIDAEVARGYSKFFLQDFAGAADDLREASKLNENALVWLFLAQSRLGKAGAAEDFAKEAAQWPAKNWIRVVADHFSTDKPDDDLLATVHDPERRCDALFYLGEVALAKKDTAHAKQVFLAAADACPIDPKQFSGSLREYVGAAEELKRLY